MFRHIDLTGQRFGRLRVIGYVRTGFRGGRRCDVYWLCRCGCGVTKEVRGSRLREGRTKSCGCVRHIGKRAKFRHSDFVLEYESWQKMHDRCRRHVSYAGRGIKVCERWGDFLQFLSDMGPRPSKRHSLERLDGNGDYAPGNCVWAPAREQARNGRNTIFVEYGGQRVKLVELCERLGISANLVAGRLRRGWLVDRALNIPVDNPSTTV